MLSKIKILFLAGFLSLSLTLGTAPALADDRADFVAAERAWTDKDRGEYERLKKRLEDYPLYQYLEYRELATDLESTSAVAIDRFIRAYPDGAMTVRLRRSWLARIASEGRWADYIRFFDPTDDDITRRCHYLHALVATGRTKEAFSDAPEIWLYGHSRPDACNPLFDAWRAAGGLTSARVWERIGLAMDSGATRLAQHLERYLPAGDKAWLQRWLDLHDNPEALLAQVAAQPDHPVKLKILAQGIERLARSDPHRAAVLWKDYRRRFDFGANLSCAVDERLAIKLEDEADDRAYDFFHENLLCHQNERVQEGRIRAGLLREDWPAILRWIGELPGAQGDEDRWRYWKARALEAGNRNADAKELYRKAASERTYYGFLAADHIDSGYRDDNVPAPVSAATLKKTADLPAVQRMHELYALGRETDARREWWYFAKRSDADTLLAAARIFHDWGWTDRAIFSAARAEYWDDLEIRFPLRHTDRVKEHANERRLDPAWVFGVLRQESAFMASVRSSAGAVGLMQLLPPTAQKVAKEFGLPKPSAVTLRDPDTNIALGSGYLRMMLDEFGNQPTLATAAYNAGPHRVRKWRPARKMPADIWVELIPFPETRGYVQRVMAYTVIYSQRLGNPPVRLATRMGSIDAGGEAAATSVP